MSLYSCYAFAFLTAMAIQVFHALGRYAHVGLAVFSAGLALLLMKAAV